MGSSVISTGGNHSCETDVHVCYAQHRRPFRRIMDMFGEAQA
jgi:hypothetical protein